MLKAFSTGARWTNKFLRINRDALLEHREWRGAQDRPAAYWADLTRNVFESYEPPKHP